MQEVYENMTLLDNNTYLDKVRGCFTGKNIGGTFGAPYECKRQINTVTFYSQDLSMGPPANDDLDLQIVWLNAVERYGRMLNSHILAEYWMSYIVPNWVEYGMAKANLRAGLVPPLSGYEDNTYGESNGAFIRSEIWACLAPGHPEIAAAYAYEDAIVDHHSEGVLGEVFFSAVESAAFVIDDLSTLIDIGLSYIPEQSATARAIRMAIDVYNKGASVDEARIELHNAFPGTFGLQGIKLKDKDIAGSENMIDGAPGFDEPENVAFVVAALMYGESDFEKSLLTANYFGEDTDCICATLCSIIGIIEGDTMLPDKWKEPLADLISTCCIKDTSIELWIPKTVSELTMRIAGDMPFFIGQRFCDIFGENGMIIKCLNKKDMYASSPDDYIKRINSFCKNSELSAKERGALSPFIVRYRFPTFFLHIDYIDSIYYRVGVERIIKIRVYNDFYWNEQQWANIEIFAGLGVDIVSGGSVLMPLNNLSGTHIETEVKFVVTNKMISEADLFVNVSLKGRHSEGSARVRLMQGAN